MEFTITKRMHVEMGDWNYYEVEAQTENAYRIDDPQWALRPKAVAIIKFNCSLAEGERLVLGTKCSFEPVVAHG